MIYIFNSEQECSFTTKKMGFEMLRKAQLIAYKLRDGSYKILKSRLPYFTINGDHTVCELDLLKIISDLLVCPLNSPLNLQ